MSDPATMRDCPDCDGEGQVCVQDRGTLEMGPCWYDYECPTCGGVGRVPDGEMPEDKAEK